LTTHSSRPYNPDIANTLFRNGYIESWGRGIFKMTEKCLAAGLPKPTYFFEGSDFWVEFRKDIYHQAYLVAIGLNERQVKAVLFVKEKGKITNSDYQELNDISKTTATDELNELVKLGLLGASNAKGRGSRYTLLIGH